MAPVESSLHVRPDQPDKSDPCLRNFILERSKALDVKDGHGGSIRKGLPHAFSDTVREYSSFFA